MALTATDIPVLPSWDETIVPALRKRLESESRTLSKRMSAVSVASVDELHSAPDPALRDRHRIPPYSVQSQKGATAPRPSLQQPRPSLQGPPRPSMHKSKTSDTSNIGHPAAASSRPVNGTRPAGYQRSRSRSQPFAVDPSILIKAKANSNGDGGISRNGNPSLESGRSISPNNTRTPEVKPTRIPKVATSRGDRSGSVSSHGHTPHAPWSPSMGNGFGPQTTPTMTGNGFGPHTSRTPPEISQDLWTVDGGSPTSRSTRREAGVVNEHASTSLAYVSMSQQSHGRVSEDSAPPRPSIESEERPFEHWYRGEVSRNGGVGELRVGKRMEMLEIANYGHTLRKATVAKNQSQVPTYTKALVDFSRRKRADSLSGMSTRESFYMDDDEKAGINGIGGYLVDEGPLTDLDGSADDHEVAYGYTNGKYGFSNSTPPPLPNDDESEMETKRSATPTSSLNNRVAPPRQGSMTATRIPGPSQMPRQVSEPPRAVESTPMARGASEPPSLPSTTTAGSGTRPSNQSPQSQSLRLPRSNTQPLTTPSQLQPLSQKRRAKSPAASTSSSTSKKAKVNKNLARIRDEKNRRSVAEYPSPPSGDEGNLMDAIPSWTQPVLGDEDWDEVVIPVVARKKGLDTRYETADGGPKPKKKTDVVAPAPGTFAYDHSKYRPPRDDGEIPLDEFGRVEQEPDIPEQRTVQDTMRDERPIQSVPFSHYAPHQVRGKEERIQELVAVVDLDQRRDEKGEEGEKVVQEDGDQAGCCKCVIM